MAASDEKVTVSGADPRPHLNLVFMGHVDHGKSTLCGRILYASGEVDQRLVEKYEREAKEKNRGSWWLAYIFDTNEEERAKGKTVEVGRAPFATPNRRFTILDAPGHKNYVPNMIAGAAQADVGVLVISAKRGEFESGFEKAGQTREHAMLAKTLGVSRLIVAVNKMDDESVQWSQERFDAIKDKLFAYLRSLKYPMKKGVDWIPISALGGGNIAEPIGDACPWYKGPCFLQLLDGLTLLGARDPDGALRVPILDKFKDRGLTTLLGKIESGTVRSGDRVVIMPNRQECTVGSLGLDTGDVEVAACGENIQIRLKNVETSDITAGMVLCNPDSLCSCATSILAQLCIMEIKNVFSAGYMAVMHIHTCTVEVEVTKLLALYDKTGKTVVKKRPTFVPPNSFVAVVLQLQRPVCLELFAEYQQLGRFTLREEGRTIAVGKVTKILSQLDNGAADSSAAAAAAAPASAVAPAIERVKSPVAERTASPPPELDSEPEQVATAEEVADALAALRLAQAPPAEPAPANPWAAPPAAPIAAPPAAALKFFAEVEDFIPPGM